MSSTEAGVVHAGVKVLPSSSWVMSDSLVKLTPEAASLVAEGRRNGLRVIASVGQGHGGLALSELWNGALDGLIVPSGSFAEPVTRPAATVLLASDSADQTMDGALEPFGFSRGEWLAIDSVFVSRAPSQDQPAQATSILVPDVSSSPLGVLSPGSVFLKGTTPAEWAPLLEFRENHHAIAAGVHLRLQAEPYAFYRGLRTGRETTDKVIVVVGAQGSTRVNVSSVFDDDVILKDVLTGAIGLVSYGQLVLTAGPTGMLLLEVLD
ncbi:MAG: hypothetical protein ACI9W4_002245 [Rhodothermales bacterium]|jgi:hypothetical protein